MTNWKTSLLGFFALILGITALVLVYLDKASLVHAGAFLALIMPFIQALNGFLSKDHDKGGNDFDLRSDSIPGGGLKKDKP